MDLPLIVINGPIGAGKSAVSKILAAEIRLEGYSAAVFDLDDLYFMIGHRSMDSPDFWRAARRGAASLSDSFIASGIDCVILEGPFWNEAERMAYQAHLTQSGEPRYITLLVSFDEALRRVRDDTCRTI